MRRLEQSCHLSVALQGERCRLTAQWTGTKCCSLQMLYLHEACGCSVLGANRGNAHGQCPHKAEKMPTGLLDLQSETMPFNSLFCISKSLQALFGLCKRCR